MGGRDVEISRARGLPKRRAWASRSGLSRIASRAAHVDGDALVLVFFNLSGLALSRRARACDAAARDPNGGDVLLSPSSVTKACASLAAHSFVLIRLLLAFCSLQAVRLFFLLFFLRAQVDPSVSRGYAHRWPVGAGSQELQLPQAGNASQADTGMPCVVSAAVYAQAL